MPPLSIDYDKSDEILLIVLTEKLEKQEFELPPLPQVASQVLALTTDPYADASKLTALIGQDPILTAKLFQTSNSLVQGSTRQIDSLQQAIAWLGINTVAVYLVSPVRGFQGAGLRTRSESLMETYVDHSVLC